MAHSQQFDFLTKVKKQYPQYFVNTCIVEMGSLNINGTVRVLFENPKQYVGIDLGEGQDVDVICKGEDYDAPDESFDVAISAECFEHNPAWAETFENMYRLTKKNGLITFTCASEGRYEHGTSRTLACNSPFTAATNYYKNLNQIDFDPLVENLGFQSHYFEYNPASKDLYFWGVK